MPSTWQFACLSSLREFYSGDPQTPPLRRGHLITYPFCCVTSPTGTLIPGEVSRSPLHPSNISTGSCWRGSYTTSPLLPPPGVVHSTPLHLPYVGCSLLSCLLRAIFVTPVCDKVVSALPQRTHALFSQLPKSGVLALTCSLSVELVDFWLVSCYRRRHRRRPKSLHLWHLASHHSLSLFSP